MTSRIFERSRISSKVRVSAKQHRQLRAVKSPKPWCRRKVSPVAGVFVAVSGETGLLAKTSGFGGWAEECGQKAEFGEGRVGARGFVRSEWNAVLGVGADDGGLWVIVLVWEGKLGVNEAYNLCLLAFQHTFGVVGEDNLVISHREETNARLLGGFCIASNEVVDFQSIHASHTLQQSGRVAAKAATSHLFGNEGEVALRFVVARDVCESCTGVERHASSDRVLWVDEAVVVHRDGSSTLAPDDDPLRVATESSDVVSSPFHSTSLIEETDILFIEARCVWESEDVDAVVERQDDVVLGSLDPLGGNLSWDIHTTSA